MILETCGLFALQPLGAPEDLGKAARGSRSAHDRRIAARTWVFLPLRCSRRAGNLRVSQSSTTDPCASSAGLPAARLTRRSSGRAPVVVPLPSAGARAA